MKDHQEELDFLQAILATVRLSIIFCCFPRSLHMTQLKECFQHFMPREAIATSLSQPFELVLLPPKDCLQGFTQYLQDVLRELLHSLLHLPICLKHFQQGQKEFIQFPLVCYEELLESLHLGFQPITIHFIPLPLNPSVYLKEFIQLTHIFIMGLLLHRERSQEFLLKEVPLWEFHSFIQLCHYPSLPSFLLFYFPHFHFHSQVYLLLRLILHLLFSFFHVNLQEYFIPKGGYLLGFLLFTLPSIMKVCFMTQFYLIQFIHVLMKKLIQILNVYFQEFQLIFIPTLFLLIFIIIFTRAQLLLRVVYLQEFLQFILYSHLQHLTTFALIYFPLQEVCHQKFLSLIFLLLIFLFLSPLLLHVLLFLLDLIVFILPFHLHYLCFYPLIHLSEGCLQKFIQFILFCFQGLMLAFLREQLLPRVDYLQEFPQLLD